MSYEVGIITNHQQNGSFFFASAVHMQMTPMKPLAGGTWETGVTPVSYLLLFHI